MLAAAATVSRAHSGADGQLYIWRAGTRGTLLLVVHTDDLLIGTGSEGMRTYFMSLLEARFKTKVVGIAERALGCNIVQDPQAGIVRITLESYVATAAARFGVDLGDHAYDVPAPEHMVRACVTARPVSTEI